jgi:hypothetical protein
MAEQLAEFKRFRAMIAFLDKKSSKSTTNTTGIKIVIQFAPQIIIHYHIPNPAILMEFPPRLADYLGNSSCINNARSSYLQCAVNPMGDCGDCKDYRDIVEDSEYLESDSETRDLQITYARMQGFKGGEYSRRYYLFSPPCIYKQVFDFKTGNQLHKNSASCVMPVALLCKAISMARHDLADDHELSGFEHPPHHNDNSINYEECDSVKIICDWWNNAMPGCLLKAAFFFLNVRVQDNDVYFDGYGETPARDADTFIEDRQSQARVRDYVLIDFFASTSMVGEDDNVLLVDGGTSGLDMQPYGEPAYHCWWSLRHFPEQFPALFEYFKKQSTY